MSDRWAVQAEVEALLDAAGVPTPDVDARLLLDAVEERFGSFERCDRAVLDGMVARRVARVPLQVVLGHTTFRWVELEVREGVFVPRPETEIVAGLAIDAARAAQQRAPDRRPLVVEPCTGTGAITCAVLSEVPGVTVIATDTSWAAVALARDNVERLRAGAATAPRWVPRDVDVVVHEGNLLDPLVLHHPTVRGEVDVLVANPPYLPAADLTSMAPEVADHDPHRALFGGVDGHEVVHELLREAASWLRLGGTVVLEIDDRRAEDAVAAASAAGLVGARVELDLTGRPRALVAQRA